VVDRDRLELRLVGRAACRLIASNEPSMPAGLAITRMRAVEEPLDD
jgi:hypothetical protein